MASLQQCDLKGPQPFLHDGGGGRVDPPKGFSSITFEKTS